MRMLDSFRNLCRLPEVRRRMLWTLGLLAVFRLGTHLPLPGVHPAAIQEFAESASRAMGGLWGYLELLTGGALGKLGLSFLGIAPYITASILVQMWTRASAALEAVAQDGPSGRRRIQQLVRAVTVPVCLVQAGLAAWHLRGASLEARLHGSFPLLVSEGMGTYVLLLAGMTAGSLFTLWLAEEITERGLGNGQSMIILAGIVARLPGLAAETLRRAGEGRPLLLALLSLAAVVGAVFVTRAERRIPLHAAKQIGGRRLLEGGRNYLPFRVNSAGVMPIIFASSAFVLPQVLGLIPGLQWIRAPFERPGFVFTLLYCAAIVFFSYFWTFLFYPPAQIALRLQEAGSFIPGLRPGPATARFLNGILARITLGGASFLAALSLLPGHLVRGLGGDVRWESFIGGSSLLIVVGVGLDLVQKLDSYLLMHRYGGFLGPSKS
jgi:preprotein translocase subunit SecY